MSFADIHMLFELLRQSFRGRKSHGHKSDLTIEALRDILVEKGDDIRFSDIPEEYFYVISSTLVPQLRYPINDELSFYIMQLSEDKFSVILTVRSEDGEMDFTGAEEILAYIESIED